MGPIASRLGSIPKFLRKPTATCDCPVGADPCPCPPPPPSGSAHAFRMKLIPITTRKWVTICSPAKWHWNGVGPILVQDCILVGMQLDIERSDWCSHLTRIIVTIHLTDMFLLVYFFAGEKFIRHCLVCLIVKYYLQVTSVSHPHEYIF